MALSARRFLNASISTSERVPRTVNKVHRQAAFALLEQLTQPSVLLVASFVLAKSLSAEDFGLFTYVLTIPACSFLLSAGSAGLLARDAAVESDAGRATDGKVAAVVLYTSAFGGALLLAAILGWAASAKSFTQMHSCIFAGVLAALIQEIDLAYSSYLRGIGKVGTAAVAEILGRLVWIGGIVWASSSEDLVLIVLAAIGGSAVKLGLKIQAYLRYRVVGKSTNCTAKAKMLPSLLKSSVWLCVQSLGGLLLFTVDRLVVGELFGAAVMGRYVACTQVAALTLAVPAALGPLLMQTYIKSKRQGRPSLELWRRTACVVSLCCALPGLAVALLSKNLLHIWLGADVADDYWITLAILGASTGLAAAAIPFHFALLAEGRTAKLAIVNLLAGCVGLVLGVMLSPMGLNWFSAGRFAFSAALISLPLAVVRSSEREIQPRLERATS